MWVKTTLSFKIIHTGLQQAQRLPLYKLQKGILSRLEKLGKGAFLLGEFVFSILLGNNSILYVGKDVSFKGLGELTRSSISPSWFAMQNSQSCSPVSIWLAFKSFKEHALLKATPMNEKQNATLPIAEALNKMLNDWLNLTFLNTRRIT